MTEKQNGNGKPPPVITRALSVCEPFAWAIVAGPDCTAGRGWKPIENRSWPTAYRGWLAIQASTARRYFTDEQVEEIGAFIFGGDSRIVAEWNKPGAKEHDLFHFGAIVGAVQVVGCVPFDGKNTDKFERDVRAAGLGWWLEKYDADDYGAEHGPQFKGATWSEPAIYWAEPGYCFLLDGAIQFTQPIPAKGKLNIYHLSPQEIAAVGRALRAPRGCPVAYRQRIATAKKSAAAQLTAAAAGR